MCDKDEILAILETFASTESMGVLFIDNATSDFLFIIPSGNPIDANGFQEMWTSGYLILQSAEITKVHKFYLLSTDTALCAFTLATKFTYKGTHNDDIPTVTSILKKINDKWKEAWMQS